MRPLTEIYHNGEIPFNARGVSHLDEMGVVLAKLNEPIADILQVSRHFFLELHVNSRRPAVLGSVRRHRAWIRQ